MKSINILQTTCQRVPIHKTCLQGKLAKCEQCAIETLINNSLTGKDLFYHLNEEFVSNRAGDIIFFVTRDLIGEQQTMNISQASC